MIRVQSQYVYCFIKRKPGYCDFTKNIMKVPSHTNNFKTEWSLQYSFRSKAKLILKKTQRKNFFKLSQLNWLINNHLDSKWNCLPGKKKHKVDQILVWKFDKSKRGVQYFIHSYILVQNNPSWLPTQLTFIFKILHLCFMKNWKEIC